MNIENLQDFIKAWQEKIGFCTCKLMTTEKRIEVANELVKLFEDMEDFLEMIEAMQAHEEEEEDAIGEAFNMATRAAESWQPN